MAVTELLLDTGERVQVEGGLQQVEQALIAAARGAMMDLAHLVEVSTGATIAINPAHVVALRQEP
jgi:hypothetical protein